MFFDFDETPLKKRSTIRVPPQVPETGWRAPSYYPNLSDAAIIGFDVERKEDDWAGGPGWRRGKARTCGFSIAAKDRLGNRGKWYFPIDHQVDRQDNLNREQSLSWLKYTLETTPHIPKVGANLIYDIGSLTDDNIYVSGPVYDVQFAEALLQSDGLVNLDWLGVKYLGQGKETNLLYKWLAEAYGGPANADQRMNIWRSPPKLAGPYGEADAMMPIDILEKQWPLLEAEGLLDLFIMECELIILLVKMRLQGVRVDIEQAQLLDKELTRQIIAAYDKLREACGVSFDGVTSPRDVARIFDSVGVKYPVTELGNPSFRKDWLKNLEHPIADQINTIRELEKVQGTFLRSYILKGHVNGLIHCEFHPLRGDINGTITGRFASSKPNLQNIPIRTDIGKLIRRIFVAHLGHVCYEKDDFSQEEYRFLACYAVDKGDGSAERLRQAYRDNPKTDYHAKTQSNVKDLTGILIERRPIKNMNFGLVYGMQENKLIRQNGFTPEQGKKVFEAYHQGNPYVRPTMDAAATEMQRLGYITTILGRRTRFNLWEPVENWDKPRKPGLLYEHALRTYGSRIKRAGEHKAINYRLQGSNADHIKKGMRDCHKAGIFDHTGVPLIQVHDELGFSVPNEDRITNEAFTEMRRILETSIPLPIPFQVDWKRGPSWGECE